MTNLSRTPGASEDEPVESRRSDLGQIDPDQPAAADDESVPAPERPEFGELAPEAARPSPLDDIAEAEREELPRD